MIIEFNKKFYIDHQTNSEDTAFMIDEETKYVLYLIRPKIVLKIIIYKTGKNCAVVVLFFREKNNKEAKP